MMLPISIGMDGPEDLFANVSNVENCVVVVHNSELSSDRLSKKKTFDFFFRIGSESKKKKRRSSLSRRNPERNVF